MVTQGDKMIDVKCKKCGNEEASVEYHGDKVTLTKTLGGTLCNHSKADVDDFILCTCVACGYQWKVSPLDSQPVATRNNNIDDPSHHNVSGSMNRPAGYFKDEIVKGGE